MQQYLEEAGKDPAFELAPGVESGVKLELVPMGSSGGSQVCQVADAGCTGQPTLRCAPDCSNQSGKLVVVPFGLGLLNGK